MGIISGLLHMDDLGQVVCDEADLRRALARVCSWLYEHGHEISPKKLVLAALAGRNSTGRRAFSGDVDSPQKFNSFR